MTRVGPLVEELFLYSMDSGICTIFIPFGLVPLYSKVALSSAVVVAGECVIVVVVVVVDVSAVTAVVLFISIRCLTLIKSQ